jgi:hypothetical protein
MWIEIDLSVTDPNDSGNVNEWRTLFNSNLVTSISPNYYGEGAYIELVSQNFTVRYFTFSDELTKALYSGFFLALQGQETKFEGIGYIKPLLNEQREQLHKHLLYRETLNSLTSDVG